MPPRLLRELTPRQRAAAKSLPSDARAGLEEWCALLQHVDRAVTDASAIGGSAFIQRMADLQRLPARLAAGDAQCGFPALAAILAILGIPASLLRECIDGASLDLVRAQPRDPAQLDQFLFKIAGVPMLVACRTAGASEADARPTTEQVGALAQTIAHLPRVGQDLTRGRIYVTLEAMNAAGVTREDLATGRMNPALRSLAATLAADAASLLAEIEPRIAAISAEAARAFAQATHRDSSEALQQWIAGGHDFFAPVPAPTLASRIRSAFSRAPKSPK
jgi:phytoene synthase